MDSGERRDASGVLKFSADESILEVLEAVLVGVLIALTGVICWLMRVLRLAWDEVEMRLRLVELLSRLV